MTTFWCEHAWLGDGPVAGVRVPVVEGRIAAVQVSGPAPGDDRLSGLVLPGFANAHSHAFHRALRGRTHDEGGTFWTWRERMYAVAARLDPDSYLVLARAAYAEMALAGVTVVGEFHYLHHPAGGGRYADPNTMGEALIQAAADAGVRLTLLAAPVLPTGAGHDAGILAAAGIPTAMLFVRNPTGVSHSPAEHAEPADCSAGVAALARAIEALA